MKSTPSDPSSHPARRPSAVLPRRRLLLQTALAAGTSFVLGCSRSSGPRGTSIAPGATILCLGDSLTAGVGADAASSYPRQLAQSLGHPCINGGVSGDTSDDALERLPALLEAEAPALVLVSIGGNDFLRGVPLARTEAALRALVDAARAGAQVALIAQPRPAALAAALGALKDHEVYARVAADTGVALFAEGWSWVLSRPELRADPIHANADGYARFTERLAQWLRETGFVA